MTIPYPFIKIEAGRGHPILVDRAPDGLLTLTIRTELDIVVFEYCTEVVLIVSHSPLRTCTPTVTDSLYSLS